ncbi:ABC transporter permease [Actinophytocola oryzae]|uniref:Osmoprotectant transport system permease protein n=1 Tax=Actinophytocola oryzae TaxID=502181 RepID=A0A4R7UW59_9PSEU|nr:ABC transporter permease [Actinophytocola oryzae]TDV41013.1 osmoprotectant transport system permease protein [Actinophytocola oryzae]
MTAVTDPVLTTGSGSRRAEIARLLLQPIVAVVLVGAVLVWAFSSDLDAIEVVTLNSTTLLRATWEHVLITVAVTCLVVVVAIPLGIVLTRRWARPIVPVFLGIATVGQAAPAIGVVVLYFLWTEQEGVWAAAVPLAFVSLLPVLRNTMVGIQQVDPSLVDAGRGIGMSSFTVMRRVELPLAVPLILAGLRTSLVLAVGTATLALFVNGGGLGFVIDTGYKVARTTVLLTGATLAVGLALLVDWLGALAERYLGPKGLR